MSEQHSEDYALRRFTFKVAAAALSEAVVAVQVAADAMKSIPNWDETYGRLTRMAAELGDARVSMESHVRLLLVDPTHSEGGPA